MKKYKLTLFGFMIAALVQLGAIIFDVDVFERLTGTMAELERYEVDEIFIPILILCGFAFVDLILRGRAQQTEMEKVKIYHAMLASTHHILNNFLNQMQVVRFEADKTPGFDPAVLTLYERIIEDATVQIDALGSITQIDALSIHASVAPQSSGSAPAPEDAARDDRPD